MLDNFQKASIVLWHQIVAIFLAILRAVCLNRQASMDLDQNYLLNFFFLFSWKIVINFGYLSKSTS